MATDKRTYPNDYFAWYNDDDRIAILTNDTTAVSGERTSERYDTYQGGGSSGSITAVANYPAGSHSADILVTSADHGLANNTVITVSGTDDYDGSVTITKVDKDTFYYEETYTSSQTGSWSTTNLINGIRLTFHSKYEELTAVTDNLQSGGGLDSSLHSSVVCYVKSRLLEDAGDVQRAQYFRNMYDKMVKQYPLRKSGVRVLSVPKM